MFKRTRVLRELIALCLFLLCTFSFLPNALAATKPGVTLDKIELKNSQSNCVVYATINNPNKKTITDVGIIVTSKNKSDCKTLTEKCNSAYKTKTSVAMWYDFNKELGLKLKPNTDYGFELFAYIGGVKYTTKGGFCTSSVTTPAPVFGTGGITSVPFISNYDLKALGVTDWVSGCYISCITMALQAMGKTVDAYSLWAYNGGSYIKNYSILGDNYGVSFGREWISLSGNQDEKKSQLINALNSVNTNERVLLVQVNANCKETGIFGHLVLVYLNSNGELRVNDPGTSNGNNVTFETDYMMSSWKDAASIWNNITWYRTIRVKS